MVLVSTDRDELVRARAAIETFLRERLGLTLRPEPRDPFPVARGVEFVGWKTWWNRRLPRRRTLGNLTARLGRLRAPGGAARLRRSGAAHRSPARGHRAASVSRGIVFGAPSTWAGDGGLEARVEPAPVARGALRAPRLAAGRAVAAGAPRAGPPIPSPVPRARSPCGRALSGLLPGRSLRRIPWASARPGRANPGAAPRVSAAGRLCLRGGISDAAAGDLQGAGDRTRGRRRGRARATGACNERRQGPTAGRGAGAGAGRQSRSHGLHAGLGLPSRRRVVGESQRDQLALDLTGLVEAGEVGAGGAARTSRSPCLPRTRGSRGDTPRKKSTCRSVRR